MVRLFENKGRLEKVAVVFFPQARLLRQEKVSIKILFKIKLMYDYFFHILVFDDFFCYCFSIASIGFYILTHISINNF